MNIENTPMTRAEERKSLIEILQSSPEAADVVASMRSDLQSLAIGESLSVHLDSSKSKLGDHIGNGIYLYRVSMPKFTVLAISYLYGGTPPPVIEALYHSHHHRLHYRAVPYVH